jgi:hypothetical protein
MQLSRAFLFDGGGSSLRRAFLIATLQSILQPKHKVPPQGYRDLNPLRQSRGGAVLVQRLRAELGHDLY